VVHFPEIYDKLLIKGVKSNLVLRAEGYKKFSIYNKGTISESNSILMF
jgi:hypothetical protein